MLLYNPLMVDQIFWGDTVNPWEGWMMKMEPCLTRLGWFREDRNSGTSKPSHSHVWCLWRFRITVCRCQTCCPVRQNVVLYRWPYAYHGFGRAAGKSRNHAASSMPQDAWPEQAVAMQTISSCHRKQEIHTISNTCRSMTPPKNSPHLPANRDPTVCTTLPFSILGNIRNLMFPGNSVVSRCSFQL